MINQAETTSQVAVNIQKRFDELEEKLQEVNESMKELIKQIPIKEIVNKNKLPIRLWIYEGTLFIGTNKNDDDEADFGYIIDDGDCYFLSSDKQTTLFENWVVGDKLVDESHVEWKDRLYWIKDYILMSSTKNGDKETPIYNFLHQQIYANEDENLVKFKHNNKVKLF